ncbi:hypothetical protein CDD82_1358 [Ophiocordyceps australis]|uniref:Large ribosomal subunit protein uL6 alpha-beta domain-containing protein n=1 Tax=Ophiocordyceps australis TaxID=1399860 RepID=A0A2C5ZMN0_9HYPO|nr:hypothetical protein CDD82_1358 [Ophiocordyceps australis]
MSAMLPPKVGGAAVCQALRARRWGRRQGFSTTTARPSKLGQMPLSIPQGVEVTLGGEQIKRAATSYLARVTRMVTVTGPLGSLELEVPSFITVEHNNEKRTISVGVLDSNQKQQKEMWGTTWSYINNHITGVSEGHTAVLRLVGVGYRASVEFRSSKETYARQPFLCLKVGYTHPIEEGVPEGVKVSTPTPSRVLLEGADRETVMSFAGRVRQWRPPEPYKGKGIFVNDQTIRLKQKKIK